MFPTFLDETRTTMTRLQTFAHTTDPLIRDLRPVARDLVPTVRDVRRLAPYLRKLFADLGPLITASKTGLPATRRILEGARPLLGQLGPFLSQLNPILQYLELNQHLVADFISTGAGGVAARTPSSSGGTGHYLRQFNPLGGSRSASWPSSATRQPGQPVPAAARARAAQGRAVPVPVPVVGLQEHDLGRPAGPDRVRSEQDARLLHRPVADVQGQEPKFPHITANSYK